MAKLDELISLEEIREQCYLDPDDATEDKYLTLLGGAAIKTIENHTNRVVYPLDTTIPDDVENSLLFSDDIKLAALLLIGGWYENREEQNDQKVESLPFGFKIMVGPYKYIPM